MPNLRTPTLDRHARLAGVKPESITKALARLSAVRSEFFGSGTAALSSSRTSTNPEPLRTPTLDRHARLAGVKPESITKALARLSAVRSEFFGAGA